MHPYSNPLQPPPDPPSADIRRAITGPIRDFNFAMAVCGQLNQLAGIVGTYTAKQWVKFLLDAEGEPAGTTPTMNVPNATPGVGSFALVESPAGWHAEGWMELWPKGTNTPPVTAPFSERETEIWTRLATALTDLNS